MSHLAGERDGADPLRQLDHRARQAHAHAAVLLGFGSARHGGQFLLNLDRFPVQLVDFISRGEKLLRLLLETKSVGEIAAALNISAKTVNNYHYLIKQKLDVESDIELLYLGLRHGLVAAPAPE